MGGFGIDTKHSASVRPAGDAASAPQEATPSGGAGQALKPTVLPGSLPPAQVSSSPTQTRAKAAAAMAKARAPVFDPVRTQRVMDEALKRASAAEKAQHQVLEAAFKQAQARHAGVDLARANFFTRFMTFATVAVSASVAAALTVATLGAAAPLMAMTGLRLLQAVADVGCAAICWRDAKASVREGRTIQSLPLGANAMGNLLHKAYRGYHGVGEADPAAKHFATRYAAAFTVGLSMATLVTGQLFTPAATLTCQACRWAATSVASLMLPYETRVATTKTEQHGDLSGRAAVDFKSAQAMLKELDEAGRGKVLGFVKSLVAHEQQEAWYKPAAKGELQAFYDQQTSGWTDPQAPDPERARRLEDMESDNRMARKVARTWIAVNTLMNLGMAVSGISTNVIKPAM
jgi:hypothetical protein